MKCSVTSNTARWEVRIASIGCDAVGLTGHLQKSSFCRVVGLPGGSVVKNLPANTGDTGDVGSIPGSGRSPGEGNGNPIQYSCPGNPMDSGTWQATQSMRSQIWTWLSDWTTTTEVRINGWTWPKFNFIDDPIYFILWKNWCWSSSSKTLAIWF